MEASQPATDDADTVPRPRYLACAVLTSGVTYRIGKEPEVPPNCAQLIGLKGTVESIFPAQKGGDYFGDIPPLVVVTLVPPSLDPLNPTERLQLHFPRDFCGLSLAIDLSDVEAMIAEQEAMEDERIEGEGDEGEGDDASTEAGATGQDDAAP